MTDTDKDETPTEGNTPPVKQERKAGAPLGNSNGLRHGLRAGKLSKELRYVENAVNSFRRELEQLVIANKGEVSVTDAAAINSACKWERHGRIAAHWLRKEAGKLSASDRLKFSEATAKASDARDKNLRQLKLDVMKDPWSEAFDGTIKE